MITRKIKSLDELNRKEKYSEKRELLVSAELNVAFNAAQLTIFFNSLPVESSDDNNS